MTYNLFYLVRLAFYVLRWGLFAVYGLLQFMSKPGSRVIVPGVTAIAVYAMRDELAFDLYAILPDVGWDELPEPVSLFAGLAVGILLLACIYIGLSRVLTLLLGAFPPITRPLLPMRRLRVKTRPVRPVIVSLAVPKLPKRRTVRRAPVSVAGLSAGA